MRFFSFLAKSYVFNNLVTDGADPWIIIQDDTCAYIESKDLENNEQRAKVSPDPGWERIVLQQTFTWSEDGSLGFRHSVLAEKPMDKLSGVCEK